MSWGPYVIIQFPVAQPDELLGSVVARFIDRQAIRDDKVALDVLFGSRQIIPSALFQGHVDQLLEHVGHIWQASPEQVVFAHTLLPVFHPFISSNKYRKLVADLRGERTNCLTLRSGINASRLKWLATYRACPLCWASQVSKLGYCYWQRLFQCPGVECCPQHRCRLVDTGILLAPLCRHHFVKAPKQETPTQVETTSETMLLLAEQVRSLLNASIPSITTSQWSQFYQQLASREQFRQGQRIDHQFIKSKVEYYWSEEFLERYGLGFKSENHWLAAIFRKHRRSFSYLEHLICWQALISDFSSVIDVIEEASCCSTGNSKPVFHSSTSSARKGEYRSAWKNLCRDKGLSLKSIRAGREGQRVYLWLYRYDRGWLMKHKPDRYEVKPAPRVDWSLRDKKLVRQLLKLERSSWLDLNGARRSKSWYAKQINQLALLDKKLDNLPLCKQFFVCYAETVDEYQARRLASLMARLISTNQQYKPLCEIERLAGLSKQRKRPVARDILEFYIPAWQGTQEAP